MPRISLTFTREQYLYLKTRAAESGKSSIADTVRRMIFASPDSDNGNVEEQLKIIHADIQTLREELAESHRDIAIKAAKGQYAGMLTYGLLLSGKDQDSQEVIAAKKIALIELKRLKDIKFTTTSEA